MSACDYCGLREVPTAPVAFMPRSPAMPTRARWSCRPCLVQSQQAIVDSSLTCSGCLQMVGPVMALVIAFDAYVSSGEAGMIDVPAIIGGHRLGCEFAE